LPLLPLPVQTDLQNDLLHVAWNSKLYSLTGLTLFTHVDCYDLLLLLFFFVIMLLITL